MAMVLLEFGVVNGKGEGEDLNWRVKEKRELGKYITTLMPITKCIFS